MGQHQLTVGRNGKNEEKASEKNVIGITAALLSISASSSVSASTYFDVFNKYAFKAIL